MSKAKKIWIISAVVAIAAGLIIAFCAFLAAGPDFLNEMNTMQSEIKTYPVEDDFSNIKIDGAECSVRFVLSDNESCEVVCTETDKIYNNIEVYGDTLTITRKDTRKWYEHIGISFYDMDNMDITIYLPENAYDKLTIKNLSGDIEISDEFTFSEAQVQSSSGYVICKASVKQDLTVKTTSGDISVKSLNAENINVSSSSGDIDISSSNAKEKLTVQTVSGDIELYDVEAENISSGSTSGEIMMSLSDIKGSLNIHTVSGETKLNDINAESILSSATSGDVRLSDTIALEKIEVESVSGEIILNRSDARSLWLKSTSGDVIGTLLSEKLFITHTTSGDVDVPAFSSDEKCEITTTSGDIRITVDKDDMN